MDISQNISGYLTPYTYEDIVIDNTVGGKGFTATNLIPADNVTGGMGKFRLIFATVDTGDVRYTIHPGGAPVAGGPGHLLPQGSSISFANRIAASNFRAIRETSVSGMLRVTYLR